MGAWVRVRRETILFAEARRLEPRIVGVSTRTSKDCKTVLIVETAGLTTTEAGALSDALKAFRRRLDLIAEFLIVNTTGAVFTKAPDLWEGSPPLPETPPESDF